MKIQLKRALAFNLLLLLLIVAASNSTKSQPDWDSDCVEAGGANCTGWEIDDRIVQLSQPDCYAKIFFKKRDCTVGGQVYKDYLITGWELFVGCDDWGSKDYFYQNFNGLKEYIILGLLDQENELQAVYKKCDQDPPMVIASVYSASCGVWSCCEYNVAQPVIPTCDGYWSGDPPHYGVPAKVKACKYVACGKTCCRRKYTMCQRETFVNGEWLYGQEIKLISKERLKDCTEQLAPPQNPCLDGC